MTTTGGARRLRRREDGVEVEVEAEDGESAQER